MAYCITPRTASRAWRPIPLGVVLMFVFACATLLSAGNSTPAVAEKQAGVMLDQSFARAAQRYRVPQSVLMAIGYVESHWWQREGQASLDRGFGIMHLVEGSGGTLERAARLTGLPQLDLKTDSTANIEGGAALLSDISQELGIKPVSIENLAGWYQAVARYSGAQDASVRDGYAREVFRVVREGASATLPTGEYVALAPSQVGPLPAPDSVAPSSEDYPPALWVPANSSNYTVGRPYGPLSYIIIHDTEGSYASAINWFQNPSSGVSAHYVIRSSDGQVTQMVRDANTAYHAGVWDYNVRAIGIEHEGYESQPGWYTEAMYQASSVLARSLADSYGIRKDRAHIIGHYQVPNQSHTDPGSYWDWNHYMSLVRRDWAASATVDNTDAAFQADPLPIDTAHHWYVYGNGYGGSDTYSTLSVADQGSSINSGIWAASLPSSGAYDVYAYIPYVDNSTPDTASARYQVLTSGGWQTAVVSQKGITDLGYSGWAHVGGFNFDAGATAQVKLTDYTGEWGKNVWFDALMWIPRLGGLPQPTSTPPGPVPTRSATPTRTPASSSTPEATWTPGPCGMHFTDLPQNYWAYSYISYLYCDGVISGYSDGTFRPGTVTTRGQIAKMIALGFGWSAYSPAQPDFWDVPFDNPYYPYIETAYIHGVISGYGDGSFRPNNSVTRAQVTKMLVLAKGWSAQGPPLASFSDVPADFWAYLYIETAYGRGIISGYSDSTFRPGADVNRSQFSKMLALTMQAGLLPGAPIP